MSYTIQHFESLCQRFPTWTELSAFLDSDAGGRVRITKASDGESPYAVLRYVKGSSDMNAAELGAGLFRSVVWNTQTNRPVCFAPPKARTGAPPLGTSLSATEDFVDGVMINAFLEIGSGTELQLATRSVLGASAGFYSSKSFAAMFYECLANTPMKDKAGLKEVLEDYALMIPGTTAVFASFVLQHPDHRVVAKVQTPTLTCVHIGCTQPTGAIQIAERATNWPKELAKLQPTSYPIRLFHSEQEIQELLRKTGVQRGWRWQGLVMKDGFGGRWRYRTQTYTLLRALRGSDASLEDRFLRLRSEKRVREYIKHYAEDADAMWDLETKVRQKTTEILAAYVDVHKARAVAFKDLPEAYKPAVFMLHAKWRDTLRLHGFKVRMQNAIEVFNGMRSFEQKRLLAAEPYVPVAPPLALPLQTEATAES